MHKNILLAALGLLLAASSCRTDDPTPTGVSYPLKMNFVNAFPDSSKIFAVTPTGLQQIGFTGRFTNFSQRIDFALSVFKSQFQLLSIELLSESTVRWTQKNPTTSAIRDTILQYTKSPDNVLSVKNGASTIYFAFDPTLKQAQWCLSTHINTYLYNGSSNLSAPTFVPCQGSTLLTNAQYAVSQNLPSIQNGDTIALNMSHLLYK